MIRVSYNGNPVPLIREAAAIGLLTLILTNSQAGDVVWHVVEVDEDNKRVTIASDKLKVCFKSVKGGNDIPMFDLILDAACGYAKTTGHCTDQVRNSSRFQRVTEK